MICVSIGRGRHRHLIAEHRHLVDQGAKLVELRLDYINGPINLKRLLPDRAGPVVISCRRATDGGKWKGSEQDRITLLRMAIAEGVEYVDLEEDIASDIPRFGATKRIISLHDFRETPDDLVSIHRRIRELDPDIIKIATMANRPSDNLRMLQLVRSSDIPTVGLCMGDIGVPTRILAGKYGAPFTFATFSQERALAPGQLSFEQMTEIYQYDRIGPNSEVYGVIADPIGHSLSPQIHNAAFIHMGMDKVYLPFRVPREDLTQFLEDASELDIRGLSVTIPHKEAAIAALSQADGAVRGIGATNTIVFKGDQLVGHNTDYRAAMDSLEEAARQAAEGEEVSLAGKTALILGAGGAGMALAYGLIRRNVKVVIADGEDRRAEEMAERFKCRAVSWSARHGVSPDILINCTPVGMHPNVDASPYDRHYLRPSMIVFDAVYNPENTLLIKEAKSQNCTVVTGMEMFVRQAGLQFKLFTGQDGPSELMRDVVKKAISPVKD